MDQRYPLHLVHLVGIVGLLGLGVVAEEREFASGGPIERLMRHKGFERSSYDTYFAQSDQKLGLDFTEESRFRQRQMNHSGVSWHQPIYGSPSDLDINLTRESVARSEYAAKVIRLRTDGVIREYFKNSSVGPGINKARQVLTSAKDMRILGASDKEAVLEWRWGYDIFADSLKLECRGGIFTSGWYHSKFVGSFMDSQYRSIWKFRLASSFPGTDILTWSEYRYGEAVLENGITKPILKHTILSLSRSRILSTPDPWNTAVQLSFSLQF